MDPTQFLCSRTLNKNTPNKASMKEIDVFYEQHGSDFFAALARWRMRLINGLASKRNRQKNPPNFVLVQKNG